jgi:DNA-binding GntR family transcriptional regulator
MVYPSNDLPSPISRVPLHEEVTTRLRDMIVEDLLKPGERIQELEIAGQLGVSRTPIREALKVLASEGLVEMLPLRGAVVKAFTAKDAQDMLKVIAQLEALAGSEACQASDAEIAAVLSLHEEMKLQFEKRNRHDYFALNQQIHNAIVSMARNETLSSLHAILSKRMRRIRYTGNALPTNWEEAMQEHEEMAQALQARDGQRLASVMRQHIENTWPRIAQVKEKAQEAI